MNILESDNVVMFDCDDTLVLWNIPEDKLDDIIRVDNGNYTEYVLPHKKHIELLKQFKVRGHKVIVWSQGGYEWAKLVVKVLKLEDDVDLIMSKPKWYVDDLPSQEFMGKPIYFSNDKPLPVWKGKTE